MNRLTTLALSALLATGIACTAAPSSDPLPPGSDKLPTETTAKPKPAASTCDVAREAFLTGTPSDIESALTALRADKSADATAREYADYYLNRDADSPDLREMDKGLIQMYCSV